MRLSRWRAVREDPRPDQEGADSAALLGSSAAKLPPITRRNVRLDLPPVGCILPRSRGFEVLTADLRVVRKEQQMNLARLIGPLAWAYAIIVGGVLLITPEGVGPIVYQVLGALGILIGIAGFALGRRAVTARA